MSFTVSKSFKVQKQIPAWYNKKTGFTVSKSFKVQKPQIKKNNPSISLSNIWFLHQLVIDHRSHMTSHSLKSHLPPLIIPNPC